MSVAKDLPHPGKPLGLDPVVYCVFAKEVPEEHGTSCGQCAAVQHAMVDAGTKAIDQAISAVQRTETTVLSRGAVIVDLHGIRAKLADGD